ncbi:hypothetical protein CI238_09115, partial [Colletotrichum incanum]
TSDNPNDEPYEVVEEDGTVRKVRASRNTIDRVVAFARENGFRMIWIDQECIEQDNPREKELAIQAMDHVYVRASMSIGLFQAELQQKHLESLLLVYEHQMAHQFPFRRGRDAFTDCRTVDLKVMCEAVTRIANDRWNMRAWVLQEAFASSGNMLLLFPRAKDINARGWLLVCHELSQSELAVRLDVVQRCFRICAPLIGRFLSPEPASRRKPANGRISSRKKKAQQTLENADNKTTLSRILFFHPEEPEHSWTIHINNLKRRRTCNAAVALTYLKLRELLRAADKLAIVANMCGYHLRLDTYELEKTQESLAACILALSLANGDFSLLVPQMYRQPETKNALEFSSSGDAEFTWMHELTRNMHLATATSWNPFGRLAVDNAAAVTHLSESGLSFPGLLWRRGNFVDLSLLKTKYAESWQQLHAAKGLLRSPPNTIRLATTHLLFEIVQALISKGEDQVANSILNSTSHWKWNRHGSPADDGMIESLDQLPHGLALENRKGMFLLDPNPDGGYYQDWIIDRVMNDGGLWVWTLEGEIEKLKAEIESYSAQKKGEVVVGSEASETGSSTASEHIPNIEDPDPVDDVQESSEMQATDPARLKPKAETTDGSGRHKDSSHSWMLMVASLMATMAEAITVLPDDDNQKGPKHPKSGSIQSRLMAAPASVTTLAMHLSKGEGVKKEQINWRAVFDTENILDEKIKVLTPFQMVLESIPRPEMRSMSVSWVVEDCAEPDNQVDDEKLAWRQRLTVKSMVRGMWRFTLSPTGRYEIV